MGVPGSAAALLFGQPEGDDSYKILRSLRFNDDDQAYLERNPASTANQRVMTFSFWVKKNNTSATGELMIAGQDYNTSGNHVTARSFSMYFYNNMLYISDYGASNGAGNGGSGTPWYPGSLGNGVLFRDPSAWYSIICAIDTTASSGSRVKLWLNGESYTHSSEPPHNSYLSWGQARKHYIGIQKVNGSFTREADFQLADFHFIDGQQLSETDFGELDEFGLWQPKEFEGTYGTQGYHLDFADNSSRAALGYDAAGSNNWTVSSSIYPSSVSYSSSTTASPSGDSGFSSPIANLFDADDDTHADANYTAGDTTDITVTFNPAITAGSTLTTKIYQYSTYHSLKVNSGSFVVASGAVVNLLSGHGISAGDSITSITYRTTSPTSSWNLSNQWYYIKNNGVSLESYPQEVDSLVDSPTNGTQTDTGAGGEVVGNYATLNPLDRDDPGLVLSNGNLQVTRTTGSAWKMVRASMRMDSGAWYWEVQVTGTGSNAIIGVGAGNTRLAIDHGDYDHSFYYASNNLWGIAYDADNGNLDYYRNGVLVPNKSQFNVPQIGLYPCGAIYGPYGSSSTPTLIFNFGQQPFVYQNPGTNRPSANYKCLTTANLASTPITDSSQYFDIATFSGNSNGGTFSIPEFTPDFIWTKSRVNTSNHVLQDSVRGFGDNLSIYTNEAYGDLAGSGGTNNIDSVSGSTVTYGTNSNFGGNTASFAWNAGANSNRTYTVTVVNDGGNKYRFDGNGDNAVTLDLAEGSTYTFDQSHSSNSGHPLRFGTSANGTNYTTGVTHTGTPGSAGAKTTLVLGSGVSTLYYSCQYHSGMGGQINTNSTGGSTVLRGSLQTAAYDQSQTWSSSLTASSGLSGATNAFDGSVSTRAQSHLGQNYTLTFAPSSGVSFTSTLEVYCDQGDSTPTASWNGYSVNPGGGAWVIVYTGSGTINASYPLVINTQGANQYATLKGVRVDGKLLVDSGVSVPNVPSIKSVVKASPESGFSIVSWVGNGGIGQTVAHGLSAPPYLILAKNRDSDSTNWAVYTNAVGPGNNLSTNNANTPGGGTGVWGNVYPTNNVFYVSNDPEANQSTKNFIGYCFAPVEGYCSIGVFKGNGTSPEGQFVPTGFKPKWVLIKNYSSGQHWHLIDSARGEQEMLAPNIQNPAGDFGNVDRLDFVSNGFKLRTASAINNNNENHFYIAFAEHPFKTARACAYKG